MGTDFPYSFDLPREFYGIVSVEFYGSLQTSVRLSVNGQSLDERNTNQSPDLQRSFMKVPLNRSLLPQPCTVAVAYPNSFPTLVTAPQIDAANQVNQCRVIRYAVIAYTSNTHVPEQVIFITIVLQADLGFIHHLR